MALMFLTIIAGAAAGMSLLVPYMWFLGILGCAGFAYTLYRHPRPTNGRMFVHGWLFGIAYSGVAMSWWWSTIPLDWLGISSTTLAVAFLLVYWGSVTAFLGSFFGAFVVAFASIKRDTWHDAILAASLWTLMQYVQMWGFATLTAGGGSVFDAHFSSTMVGYSLASFSPLLQLASLGGIYLLTFVAVGLGFFVYFAFARARTSRITRYGIPVAVVLVIVAGVVDRTYFLADIIPGETTHTVTIGLVNTWDPGLPRDPEEWIERNRETTRSLVRAQVASGGGLDIIVMPESIGLTIDRDSAYDIRSVSDTAAIIDTGIVHGDMRFKRMFFYDAGILRGVYDKIFLVPQGEYSPWLYDKVIGGIVGKELKSHLQSKLWYFEHGDGLRPVVLRGVAVGSLFCFDVLSPKLYRSLAKDGATVLINASSHSWFHRSRLGDDGVLAISKVRAVESRRYLAIAGNEVPSSVISDRGRVVARTRVGDETILVADVPVRTAVTPYVRFGESAVLVPAAVLVFFAWRRRHIV